MSLIEKIKRRDFRVGIIGLGYVGLPLMIRFAEEGVPCTGFDIDERKVGKLSKGESYIEHIPAEKIRMSLKKGFVPTTDFKGIKDCDAIIICVPTPLNKYREPDMSYIFGTMDSIAPYLRKGQVLSLESTTYPGTTEEDVMPRVEARGLKVGVDFHLVFSPEREDPGRADFTTKQIPKLCGGITPSCLEVGAALYSLVVDKVVKVSSTQVAEMAKLLENIHRAVNIGLVNELKIVADKMGIDVHEVIAAAATKPFGFVAYSPGPGLGGHCIPIDPFYLTWKAREYGVHTRFIELAGEINSSMPHYVVDKVTGALNDRGLAVKGSKILILGLAYKKNVDDVRESPSIELIELLTEKGAKVDYSDPHVATFPKMREHHFEMDSVPLTKASLASYDCVLVATDHAKFDYPLILGNAKLIIDTRGVFLGKQANVVKA